MIDSNLVSLRTEGIGSNALPRSVCPLVARISYVLHNAHALEPAIVVPLLKRSSYLINDGLAGIIIKPCVPKLLKTPTLCKYILPAKVPARDTGEQSSDEMYTSK